MSKFPSYVLEVAAHYSAATFGQTCAGAHESGQLVFSGWSETSILAANLFACRISEDGTQASIFARLTAARRRGPITLAAPQDVVFEGEITADLPADLALAVAAWSSDADPIFDLRAFAPQVIGRLAVADKALRLWRELQVEAGEPLLFARFPTAADIGAMAPSEVAFGILPSASAMRLAEEMAPRIRAAAQPSTFVDSDNLAWQRVLLG